MITTADLSSPELVLARLEEIERDLAVRQNELERAAYDWYCAKRDREHAQATEFLRAEGTVAERNATATAATARTAKLEEALYETLRAVVRVLETRASIGQSILRAQGRV